MENPDRSVAGRTVRAGEHKLSRDTIFLIGDLLPLCDFTGVLLAAYFATLAYAGWIAPSASPFDLWDDTGRAALAAAVLAPFILCDRAFVAFASDGQTAALVRCYAVRFVMFAGVVAAIGLASTSLSSLSVAWLQLWFAGALMLTAITRVLLVASLRRLERKGLLRETIAVVGAGPLADRLVRHLLQTRRERIEILGVFDDDASGNCVHRPTGSIADLVDLGKTRTMDWILLALPGAGDARVPPLVHRLKSLSVPIGLCPPDVGLAARRAGRDVGDDLAITPLADRAAARWDSAVAIVGTVVPPWILTLLALPRAAARLLAGVAARPRPPKLECRVDAYDLAGFTQVAARFGEQRFGYVVTPNADHLIRLHREPAFRALYADADFVLLDSRFIARLLRSTRKRELPVCPGSDLTAKLFDDVITADDPLVLIGGSREQAARLAARYGLRDLAHFNPPMGFIGDPLAVEACLHFVEAHSPFRFCLLAVGAPQQEMLAQQLKTRGVARGLTLCIGASINFLTGDEQRAPAWMQGLGIEWLFRLLQAPGRMAQRYLVRGPQLFRLLGRTEFVLREAAAQEVSDEIAPAAESSRKPDLRLVPSDASWPAAQSRPHGAERSAAAEQRAA